MAEGSGSGVHRPCRKLTRDRLLKEMLGSVRTGDTTKDWKVLILDALTVKVMSSACKMTDIAEEGISLVEDLNKRRGPMPTLEAVYFIQASNDSISKMMADMTGKSPLYKRAYVFVSSPLTPELIQTIKSDKSVLSRLAALKEMNLEYLTIDSQGFVTDNDKALVQLFGENSDGTKEYEICLETIAARLATVFASLKEHPAVRYRAAKPPANDDELPSTRDLLATKLAAALWDRISKYKSTLADFPKTETCELVIVDRSIDPVAPFIHEFTYDAMIHDLLGLEGNKYVYEMTTGGGKSEHKEVLLEEHDPVWLELRHLHIAEANLRLNEKMNQFGSKNKAAQIKLGAKEGEEISTRDMQKLVQALPQFREQLDKLSLHVQIATELNERMSDQSLSQIGGLEQDFAFGGGTSKELVNLLNSKQNLSLENKLRLFLIYAATHPDKLDATKRLQWMKLAKLGGDDMNLINNMEHLGIPLSKKHSGGWFSRKSAPARKEKNQDEESWQLSRFYPVIEDVVEDVAKGELSKEDYPYVKEPALTTVVVDTNATKGPQSMRTTKSTWATKHASSTEASSSTEPTTASQVKITGKRIFIFIVGGATRSEVCTRGTFSTVHFLRVAHKLTLQLKREVIMGSTSLDDPATFVEKLKTLSKVDDADLEIDIV